jgi:hypothetical protein
MDEPTGNITGGTDAGHEIGVKRLGLLRELIPTASRVGYLVSRNVTADSGVAATREAAQQAGISLVGPPLEGTIDVAQYRRIFKLMTQEHRSAQRRSLSLISRRTTPTVDSLSSWSRRAVCRRFLGTAFSLNEEGLSLMGATWLVHIGA